MLRFLAVLVSTFVMIGLSLGIIYFWGMGRIFPKYDNPFFAHPSPWLAMPWSKTEALKKDPEAIAWIDVFRQANQTLVVDRVTGPVLLTDVIKKMGSHRLILNICSNVDSIDLQVLDFLHKEAADKQVLIQSDYDVILRAMRDDQANLPYGASQSDWLRFNTFAGLAPWRAGLLPATPFHGDVYVAPLKWKNISVVNSETVEEIHRRQKWVILGPLHSSQDVETAKSLGTDGYYIDNAEILDNFAGSHNAH